MPRAFLLIPAGIGVALHGRAIQGNHTRRVRRPEDLFQVLAKVLSVVEDDIILNHQIGVGVGMAEDELTEAEVEIREWPDCGFARGEGTSRVAMRSSSRSLRRSSATPIRPGTGCRASSPG